MKTPNKFKKVQKYKSDHKSISSVSLKLSVGEVVVLICTWNSQSMSSKLVLEMIELKIMIFGAVDSTPISKVSLYLTDG